MKSYCVFCKTSTEKNIARCVNKIDNSIKAIAPTRVLQEKRKGEWAQREQILLPGYVFLYSEEEIQLELRGKFSNLYKFLDYEIGIRELKSMDYEYSMWIYRHHGNINASKILTEGKNVKVLDGPLLDVIGTIIRLDKHKRRVWVEFEFDGEKRVISLSAECVGVERVVLEVG